MRERLFRAFRSSGTCVVLHREQGGVVDANIFLIQSLGHVQFAVYAVAKKAADLIKAGS